jgi:hypothetical protein
MRARFGPDDEDAFHSTRDELVEAYRAALEDSEDAADTFVAGLMLDYKWGYGDGRICDWRRADLDDLLLSWFPRKVSLEDEDLLRVGPEVADFLAYLDRRGLLTGDPLPALRERAIALGPEFVDAMQDLGGFGMAKQLVSAMRAEGIDPTRPGEVDRWFSELNARSADEREDLLAGFDDQVATLAPVVLSPMPDLERAAEASPTLARLASFARYVGRGRKLTQQGYLTVADGKALVESIGTGDRVDERIGDRVFRTRSTAELPRLDLVFRWARAAGFVKVQHGRVSMTRRGSALGAKPAEDWRAAFLALLKSASWPARPERAYGRSWDDSMGWLAERLPAWLYASPNLEVDRIKEVVWEEVEADYVISTDPEIRDYQRKSVDASFDRLVDRFVELGAIATTDGTIALTPLGVWATNDWMRAHGAIAPVVGELAGGSAASLLAACARMPLDAAEAEMRTWIEARPGTAVAELAQAARDGALPMMALHALSLAGPDAEAEVRAMTAISELRPQALLWLVGNGFETEASLSPEVLLTLLIETIAVQVDADGPAAAAAHFQTLGPEPEQLAILEGLVRADHPRTMEILDIIGRLHPSKAVSKAARKSAFKRRGITASAI